MLSFHVSFTLLIKLYEIVIREFAINVWEKKKSQKVNQSSINTIC